MTRRLAVKPGAADLLLRRATLHRAHDDYPAAKADLETIGKGSPRYLEALLNLTRLEREYEHLPKADAVMVRYFAKGGDSPEAWREKARLDMVMKRREAAASAWGRYLDLAKVPSADEILEAAEVMVGTKARSEARSVVERGLELHPGSIPLHQFAASLDIQRGLESSAEQRFARLRERYPALLPRLCYEEGRLWLAGNHPGKARSSYQFALHHFDQLPAAKQRQPGLQKLRREILKALNP